MDRVIERRRALPVRARPKRDTDGRLATFGIDHVVVCADGGSAWEPIAPPLLYPRLD